MRRLAAVLGVLVSAGCGEEGPGDAGAGPDSATDVGTSLTPSAPMLPILTPCPDGWREAAEPGGLLVCEPWPESGPEDCPVGRAHYPGEPGCVTVGSECPSDVFPDDLPADGTIQYVLAGTTSGDGTRAAPFDTVSAGLSAASAGDVVVVGPGVYDEILRMRAGITLRGACAAETTLRSSAPHVNEGVVIAFRDGEVALADITIGESARSGITIGFGVTVTTTGVVFHRPTLAGVVANGGTFHAEHVSVRDPVARTDGQGGMAIFVQQGSVRFDRVEVRDANQGALISVDADMALDRVSVRDTDADAMDLGGRAIQATGSGTLDASRVVVEGSRDLGVLASDADSISLQDAVVRDTRGAVDGILGRAIELVSVEASSLSRLRVERQRDVAVLVGDTGAVSASDLVIRDTESRASDGVRGRAFELRLAATGTLERAWLEGSRELAVITNDAGTELGATDLTVVGVRAQECASMTCVDERLAVGVGAFREAVVQVSRFLLTDSEICGLQVAVDGALDVSDGEVTDSVIGACVQVDGYDLGRLMTGVLYRDNDINLDTTTLPVPDAS